MLAAELQTLRTEHSELARLQRENEQLAATAAAQPPAAAEELARVQAQIAQLKSEAPTSAAPARKPAAAWRNTGIATPLATYETQLWARAHDDLAVLASTVIVGARIRPKLEAFIAGLAEPARSKFNSPEKLAGYLQAFAPWEAGRLPAEVAAFRVFTAEEMNRSGSLVPQREGTLNVATRDSGGRESRRSMLLTQTKEGWKMSFAVPDFQWEKIVAYFDPATAQPKSGKR